MPYNQVNSIVSAQEYPYQEIEPVNSFLGTDYVHDFIQKHKDVTMPSGYEFGIAHKIDSAYMNQANKGTNVNSKTNSFIYNGPKGSYTNVTTKFNNTPKYFPGRTTYGYITNTNFGNEATSDQRISSWLPSIGRYTSYDNGGEINYLNFFKK